MFVMVGLQLCERAEEMLYVAMELWSEEKREKRERKSGRRVGKEEVVEWERRKKREREWW